LLQHHTVKPKVEHQDSPEEKVEHKELMQEAHELWNWWKFVREGQSRSTETKNRLWDLLARIHDRELFKKSKPLIETMRNFKFWSEEIAKEKRKVSQRHKPQAKKKMKKQKRGASDKLYTKFQPETNKMVVLPVNAEEPAKKQKCGE